MSLGLSRTLRGAGVGAYSAAAARRWASGRWGSASQVVMAEVAEGEGPDLKTAQRNLLKHAHIDLFGRSQMAVAPMFVPGALSAAFNDPRAKPTRLSRLYYKFNAALFCRLTSILSLREMAKYRSWPANFPPLTSWSAILTGLFLGSTRESSWIAHARKAALRAYTELNAATAAGNADTVRLWSDGSARATALARLPPRDARFVWAIEREVSPVKCIAIRAFPAYPERPGIPRPGDVLNGFLIQSIFRFDTIQSLSPRGRNKSDPVPPTRVVEYLILERNNWEIGTRWKITGQATPGAWNGNVRDLRTIFKLPKEKPA